MTDQQRAALAAWDHAVAAWYLRDDYTAGIQYLAFIRAAMPLPAMFYPMDLTNISYGA